MVMNIIECHKCRYYLEMPQNTLDTSDKFFQENNYDCIECTITLLHLSTSFHCLHLIVGSGKILLRKEKNDNPIPQQFSRPNRWQQVCIYYKTQILKQLHLNTNVQNVSERDISIISINDGLGGLEYSSGLDDLWSMGEC